MKDELEAAIKCRYCTGLIYKDQEPNGEIHFHKKKPICAKCRILKFSKFSKKIIKDKPLFVEDMEEKGKRKQEQANSNAEAVAIASQEKTKSRMNKK